VSRQIERTFHRGLDRGAVLDAALAILDVDGRGALTMRRLARELDVQAASLYTHVRSKEDLIDGVLDRVLDRVPLPPPGADWRASLCEGFRDYRHTLVEHPGVITLITERSRTSSSQVRLVERSIELLESAGLTTREAVQTHVTLIAYTLGFLAQETGRSPSPERDVIATSDVFQRAVEALLTRSVDERFQAGLEIILDGATQRHGANRSRN
jgi:AcrR family transcriptional regulator